jgi:hypothetical protein
VLILANKKFCNLVSVTGNEALETFEFQFDELSADFDLRRAAGGEDEVANVLAGFQHGADELWDVKAALDE